MCVWKSRVETNTRRRVAAAMAAQRRDRSHDPENALVSLSDGDADVWRVRLLLHVLAPFQSW